MHATFDAEVDAAHISLKLIAAGESKRQVPVKAVEVPGEIVLDLVTGIIDLFTCSRVSIPRDRFGSSPQSGG
jgi:hypothetical protein